MDLIFDQLDIIYENGDIKEGFDRIYNLIYEICFAPGGAQNIQNRLDSFYKEKLDKIFRQTSISPISCQVLATWMTSLIHFIDMTTEISDILLYYNRLTPLHSNNHSVFILIQYLFFLDVDHDTSQFGEPLAHFICHVHHCSRCYDLLVIAYNKIFLPSPNGQLIFRQSYLTYVTQEWKSVKSQLQRYTHLRYSWSLRSKNGRIGVVLRKPRGRVRRSPRIRENKCEDCSHLPSESFEYFYRYTGRGHIQRWVTTSSNLFQSEMKLIEALPEKEKMLQHCKRIWEDVFGEMSPFIELYDWESLLLSNIRYGSKLLRGLYKNTKSWVQIMCFIKANILNDLLTKMVLQNLTPSSNPLTTMLCISTDLEKLQGACRIEGFVTFINACISQYFTLYVPENVATLLVSVAVNSIACIPAVKNIGSSILRKFLRITCFSESGETQKALVVRLMELDHHDPCSAVITNCLEPGNVMSRIMEKIERLVIPGGSSICLYPKTGFIGDTHRLPLAAKQLQKLIPLNQTRRKTLSYLLDAGECLFTDCSGKTITCNTGIGIILDVINTVCLLRGEDVIVQGCEGGSGNSTRLNRLCFLMDDRMFEDIYRASRLPRTVFLHFYETATKLIPQLPSVQSLLNLEKGSPVEKQQQPSTTQDHTDYCQLDCNIANFFKTFKDEWLSESDLIAGVLGKCPRFLGISAETFRDRLRFLADRDIIIISG